MVSAALPEPGSPALGQRTVAEQVLERLRELLLGGSLAPGSRLDQMELAEQFGVSIVPIREALARLQSVGLVEIVPHRGVFVAKLSATELVDIYTVRELLEEQAARIAVDHFTDADVREIEALEDAMTLATQAGDFHALFRHNRELHFAIYRAAGRRHMYKLIEQMWDLSARYAHLQLRAVPNRAQEALNEVRAMVAACRRRDGEALGLMVRYKVHQTVVGLLERAHLLTNEEPRDATAKSARRAVKARAPEEPSREKTTRSKQPVSSKQPARSKQPVKKKRPARAAKSNEQRQQRGPRAVSR